MNLFNASTILYNAIVDTFERSNNNVCKERFSCKDLANRLIPKSPTSLPLILNNFNVVHVPIKLIKSVKLVFNLQSVKYRLSNFSMIKLSLRKCYLKLTVQIDRLIKRFDKST
jgi:hypothetical protein